MPESRTASAKAPASYIRYIDPGDNGSLGYMNSGAFLFLGAGPRGLLKGRDDVQDTRDGMRVHFDGDEKVELILDVARKLKS